MNDSATTRTRFQNPTPLALKAAFDGGLCWLAETDQALGLCEAIAEEFPEWRGPSVTHALSTLVCQRVCQIACGYEYQNDSDVLRKDPLLKMVLGSSPQTGAGLASQPTISRLENTPDRRACLRIAREIGEPYVEERGKGGVPERVLLDFDATDDPTHGDQEGSSYHGYYRTHRYHPWSSSTVRAANSPRRSCGPATPTPAAAPSRS